MIHTGDVSNIKHTISCRCTWAPINRLVHRKCRAMALEGSPMLASMHSSMSVPTDMTMLESTIPTSGVTTLGFIISICMVEQCLKYDYDNIKAAYIYLNYNITKIPADAFLGAAYLKVICYPIQNNMMRRFPSKLRPCNNLFYNFSYKIWCIYIYIYIEPF